MAKVFVRQLRLQWNVIKATPKPIITGENGVVPSLEEIHLISVSEQFVADMRKWCHEAHFMIEEVGYAIGTCK